MSIDPVIGSKGLLPNILGYGKGVRVYSGPLKVIEGVVRAIFTKDVGLTWCHDRWVLYNIDDAKETLKALLPISKVEASIQGMSQRQIDRIISNIGKIAMNANKAAAYSKAQVSVAYAAFLKDPGLFSLEEMKLSLIRGNMCINVKTQAADIELGGGWLFLCHLSRWLGLSDEQAIAGIFGSDYRGASSISIRNLEQFLNEALFPSSKDRDVVDGDLEQVARGYKRSVQDLEGFDVGGPGVRENLASEGRRLKKKFIDFIQEEVRWRGQLDEMQKRASSTLEKNMPAELDNDIKLLLSRSVEKVFIERANESPGEWVAALKLWAADGQKYIDRALAVIELTDGECCRMDDIGGYLRRFEKAGFEKRLADGGFSTEVQTDIKRALRLIEIDNELDSLRDRVDVEQKT